LLIYRKRNYTDRRLLLNLIISSVLVYVVIQLLGMAGVLAWRLGDAYWVILWGFRAGPFGVLMLVQIAVAWPLLKFLRVPIEKFLIIDDEEEFVEEVIVEDGGE